MEELANRTDSEYNEGLKMKSTLSERKLSQHAEDINREKSVLHRLGGNHVVY